MKRQGDTLTFAAFMERLPRTTEIFSDCQGRLVVNPPEEYIMGWESLSQYARFCESGQEGLSTPHFVVYACLELMATT